MPGVEAHPEDGPPSSEFCRNCGAEATSSFCPACGQSTRNIDLPLWQLLSVWLGAVVAFDSRLFRTIGLLFQRPGALTLEYLIGRRRSSIHPIKLYLAVSLLLFFTLSWSGYSIVQTSDGSDSTPIAPITFTTETKAAEPAAGDSEVESDEPGWLINLFRLYEEDPERFNSVFIDRLAKAVFVLVPVFALLLKGLYRKRLYVHHLVFSLHQHSFAFLAILADLFLSALVLRSDEPVTGLASIAIPVYTFLALRRCHRQGRSVTTLKVIILGLGYLAALVLTMAVTLALTTYSL